MRILIADDDKIALEMLSKQLEDWGHQVVAARDGEEAWRFYLRDGYDVVITDWLMPVIDGLELVKRIRQSEAAHYVYVILLTVKSQMADLVEGMDAGADDYLRKPFDPSELRVRLRAGERIIQYEQKLATTNARMKRELDAAASIQNSLLPTLATMGRGKFAWTWRPCDELAGDILNIVRLGPDHVGLYLMDVTGHGVAAALISTALSRVLTTLAPGDAVAGNGGDSTASPGEILKNLNTWYIRNLQTERLATLFYSVYNVVSGELRYSSGGHNPALLFKRNGGVDKLESTGPILGFLVDADFEERSTYLEPGDRFFVYSDGVTEALNDLGEPFGIERLEQLLRSASQTPLDEALSQLVRDIEAWSQPEGVVDDVSCVVAEASPDSQ
jgi:sigma-B regulation protein RsbU (phosphoserine phosphatase)